MTFPTTRTCDRLSTSTATSVKENRWAVALSRGWRGWGTHHCKTKQACSSPPILTTPSPGHVQEGFVKIHVEAGTDKLLGATIVASNAGDMISELTLCMQVRS